MQPPAPPQGYPPQQGYQQPGYPPQQGYQPGYQQQPGYPPQGYPQPGTFAPPPQISYATPPPADQHNLNAKLIAVIVAAVVIVGGGVGAAFALTGNKDTKTPKPVVTTRPAPNPGPPTKPAPNPGPSTAPAPNPGPSTQPAPGPSTQPAPGPSTNPAPNPGPSGNGIPIAGGVTVTPAAGWQVEKHDAGLVILASSGTQLFLNVYRAQSTNITQDLVTSINTFTKGTTGLKVGKSSAPATIQGRHFTQSQDIAFQFQVATQQGTATVQGLFIEFLNPQTGIAEFCVYASTSNSALQAKAHDALTMIASTE